MVRQTSSKQSLIHNLGIVIDTGGQIINQRIDIDRFTISQFEEQYADVYNYLKTNIDELSNGDQMLIERINKLVPFTEGLRLGGSGLGGFLAAIFNLHSESKDVGKLREVHSNLSVIKMLIENS